MRVRDQLPTRPQIRREITEDDREQLCELLRRGNFLSTSLRSLGIRYDQHAEWMHLGGDPWSTSKYCTPPEQAQEPYRTYALSVRQAMAESEVLAVAELREAAERGDWRAAFAFLSARYPERWGSAAQIRAKRKREPQLIGEVILMLPDNGREVFDDAVDGLVIDVTPATGS